MAKLYNLARVSTATTGTGTITLGAAVSGYLTFALAGVADGDSVDYGIKDGANSETGTGTYTASGTTLTRSVTKSTNSNAAISLSGSAEVYITARAETLNDASVITTGTIATARLGSGTANSSSYLRGDQTWAAVTFAPKFWQGYTHSNNVGTPNTKIDVAAGSCRDSTDAINIVNSAGTIDLGTTGANGRDAGSLANTTFYYTFAITTAGGSTAYLASTSPTAPTLPGSYTKFRRIGGFKTNGSAQVLPFTHVNNQWWYSTPTRDVNTAVQGTTFISYVLSVPKVQGVVAQYSITYFASAAITINVLPGFLPTTASAGQAYYSPSSSGSTEISQTQVDSSGQIQVKSTSASSTIVVDTAGWVDDL